MTEEKEFSKEKYKLLLKTALKTLSYVFIGVMLFICATFHLSPSLSLKISKYLGSAKAQEIAYERIYEKSGKNSDLYNLILFNQEHDDLSDELKYINELMSKKNYNEFCKAIDKASLDEVKTKELIPFMCDTNAYLRSQKVICSYNLGECDEIYLIVQTSAGELSDLSVAVYIDLIHDDKDLTNSERTEMISKFASKGIVVEQVFKDVGAIIDIRIDKLKSKLNENLEIEDEIILEYSLVRFYKTKYIINSYLGNETETEKYRVLYNNENAKLIALY